MSSRQCPWSSLTGGGLSWREVYTASGQTDLGRNELRQGGTTVACSRWWTLDAADFPILGNQFSMSENEFNFPISGIISWYEEVEFPISENNSICRDIGNSNREIISLHRQSFPDIDRKPLISHTSMHHATCATAIWQDAYDMISNKYVNFVWMKATFAHSFLPCKAGLKKWLLKMKV